MALKEGGESRTVADSPVSLAILGDSRPKQSPQLGALWVWSCLDVHCGYGKNVQNQFANMFHKGFSAIIMNVKLLFYINLFIIIDMHICMYIYAQRYQLLILNMFTYEKLFTQVVILCLFDYFLLSFLVFIDTSDASPCSLPLRGAVDGCYRTYALTAGTHFAAASRVRPEAGTLTVLALLYYET